MSEVREQALVDAPVSRVWELVGDPATYPEWLPRVLEVQGERVQEGTEFIQVTHQPLKGREEIHFVVDTLDELRELRMHCRISGLFVHWQLTAAQGGTFLDAAFGMEPIRRRDRLIDLTVGRPFFRRWLADAVDGLKRATSR
jgi:uncharacterized protein YndB with AHSA1/START domain